jgi:hypothetical protein
MTAGGSVLNVKQRLPGKRGPRFWVLGGFLAAGLGVGILVASALPGLGESQPNPQLPDPNKTLVEAEAAAPYDVKLPGSLPPGATLELVVWDKDVGGVVVIDAWFSLSAGGRLHMWQTNTTSPIESIPEGESLAIGERTWSQVSVDWGAETLHQLSTRFEDGVTVTVDAPATSLDAQTLVDVAASID